MSPTTTATVVDQEKITAGAVLLTLQASRFVPAPPGSHLDLDLVVNGRRMTRSYSIVDLGRDDGTYSLCVRLQPQSRGGSRYLHSLQRGQELSISPPIDSFPPATGTAPALLLAAGIGITPLIGIANALRRRGVDYRLVCVARQRSELPLAGYLAAQHGERLTVVETAVQGRPDIARLIDDVDADGVVYVCGPLPLLETARASWARSNRPGHNFRCETFGNSGHRPETDFDVTILGRPEPVRVPADTSMLDALRAAGEELLFDCRRGECGLCVVDVLESGGEIDHRDVFFSVAQHRENRKMCACVSRVAGGWVTVDIGHMRSR